MQPSARVAARHLFATRPLDLSYYGLEGLTNGIPTTLYHGTTASFTKFDLAKSRDELVDRFYGKGIFLTPSKRVAVQYAGANRNEGLPSSVIDDLEKKNRPAGEFLRALYTMGNDAWEAFARDHGFWNDNPPPGAGTFDSVGFEDYLKVDANSLWDILHHIIGSKNQDGPREESVMDLFHPTTGSPDWLYDQLDEVGLDSSVYRPKVYTVVVTASNPLITASKTAARKARSRGYDSVIYYGPDLVNGVPEVALYDSHRVRITNVEVI